MTGYANASAGLRSATENTLQSPPATGAEVSVELRSVNSRFLDIAFRMPDEMRPVEPLLREAIAAAVRRGKIEVRIASRQDAEGALPNPDAAQLRALAALESGVRAVLSNAAPLSTHEVLNWCRSSQAIERDDAVVLQATQRALIGLTEAREREGAKLVDVLLQRVNELRSLAREAAPLVPQAVARQQERFLERWAQALETVGAAQTLPREALQERALNEAAAYAIRIDVAEELARLGAHLDEIERLLHKGGEVGKRLDFLIQELHREANTLGSKSAALELTRVSVDMKVAIEQMREQVQNLE
jgi:uncharacterized protein (TIGR00255 family)